MDEERVLADDKCSCDRDTVFSPDGSSLNEELRRLEAEKDSLEARISLLKLQLEAGRSTTAISGVPCNDAHRKPAGDENMGAREKMDGPAYPEAAACGLTPEMIHRYSRHLLLPSFGVDGQLNLSKASILVVGAGGLGSPVAMYLAACGAGCLGIVDGDNVELNNLQRQVIHTEAYVGEKKVKSAAATCRAINSTVRVVEHREALLPSNALEIMSQYDVIVDATDNLPSRYMISDCCVVLNKPLVSGAALGLEGQLTVYHYNGGPCYRCLFPTPAPAAACQRCSDSGVLGVVPGIIGCLQTLEAIKIASSIGEPLSGRMLLFDALSGRFRIVKLRSRSLNCEVCGDNSMFTRETFQSFDYENFTESLFFPPANEGLQLLMESDRISTKQYKERVDSNDPHILLDVRATHHFKIASLANSISIPLSCLKEKLSVIDSAVEKIRQEMAVDASIYVICRRGNDSQRAVKLLHQHGFSSAKDITGGLESWAKEIDQNFPMY